MILRDGGGDGGGGGPMVVDVGGGGEGDGPETVMLEGDGSERSASPARSGTAGPTGRKKRRKRGVKSTIQHKLGQSRYRRVRLCYIVCIVFSCIRFILDSTGCAS